MVGSTTRGGAQRTWLLSERVPHRGVSFPLLLLSHLCLLFYLFSTSGVSILLLSVCLRVLTGWLCRGFLLGRRCSREPRCDPSPGDAPRSSHSPQQPRRRWWGHGGHRGGHPGHHRPPVGGLGRPALCPHAHLLPRLLCLPHVVGGRLPGHQLAVWHLLPPAPHAELVERQRALGCSWASLREAALIKTCVLRGPEPGAQPSLKSAFFCQSDDVSLPWNCTWISLI